MTVVHVAKGISPADLSPYRHRFRVPESQTLFGHEEVYRRLQGAIPVALRTARRRIHARAVTGDPATEIIRVARAVDADVTVVGVRARGVVGRRIFGAMATRIMTRAGRLVLAVPEIALLKQPPPSDVNRVAAAA
jgi:nucleotide-binding universal stress UspA family protein